MSDTITYNIPVAMCSDYSGRNVIVRSMDPAAVVEGLAGEALDRVSYVQILSIRADLHPLMLWGRGVPVDLVVQSPASDLPLLYQISPLLARHPVRITVPVVPGFSKVVKLAVSLGFAVKLEVLQPDRALVEELSRVLDAYLHQPMVSQPVEYFHSMFLAFFRGEPLTLWAIQEDDPARTRYVTDDGGETLSARFAGAWVDGDIALFPESFKARLVADGGECSTCEFLEICSGYFKWPRLDYPCDGVRGLFQTLVEAARQLKGDLEAFEAMRGEERS